MHENRSEENNKLWLLGFVSAIPVTEDRKKKNEEKKKNQR